MSLPSQPPCAFMLPNNLSQIATVLKTLAVSQGRIQRFPGESPHHRDKAHLGPRTGSLEPEGQVFAVTDCTTVVSIALVKSR